MPSCHKQCLWARVALNFLVLCDKLLVCRVCIVNADGNVLLDVFVEQREEVKDYRTEESGITAEDLTGGKAKSFDVVQE